MRLRVIGYQIQVRLRTLLPCFHKAHIENLGIASVKARDRRGYFGSMA